MMKFSPWLRLLLIASLIGLFKTKLVMNGASIYALKGCNECNLFNLPFEDEHSWLIYRCQKSDLAIQTLLNSLLKKPDHLIIKLRLGEIYWKLGSFSSALNIWRSVPDSDLYFAYYSSYLAKQDVVKDALLFAEISQNIDKTIDSRKHLMYRELCELQKKEGELGQALAWCKLDANAVSDGWAQIRLANIQKALGDSDAAIHSLKLALDVAKHPSALGQAYRKLGDLYIQDGRVEKGISSYRDAIKIGFEDMWLYVNLAKALLKVGNRSEACEHIDQAQSLGYQLSGQEEKWYFCASNFNE